MAIRLEIGQRSFCSHLGTRSDSIAVKVSPHATVCLIADGVGHDRMAAAASKKAIEVAASELNCRISPTTTKSQSEKLIRDTYVRTAKEMSAFAGVQNQYCGATLLVAVWQQLIGCSLATFGHSRGYLLRDETVQETVDNDVSDALVRAGAITHEEARNYVPFDFLGMRSIREGPIVETVDPLPGDHVLLCSDGLYRVIPDVQFWSRIRGHLDVQSATDSLVQWALDNGSKDNVSCILVRVEESDLAAEIFEVDPAWLNWNHGCVTKLVRSIQDESKFSAMPILADALEDAGCTNAALLAHCREPGHHLEDCWALNALLPVGIG